MKFILGYLPNTQSKLHPGPKVFWHLVRDFKGKRYEFERVEKIGEVYLPRLKVYNSEDYPDEVIQSMLKTKEIVELAVEADDVHALGK